MKNQEFEEQVVVVNYLKKRYPDVLFMSDLSGIWMPKLLAFKLARIRGTRGIPDIIIFEKRGGCSGLAIELKASTKPVTKKNGELKKDEHIEEQAFVQDKLRKQGWMAEFCIGAEQAIKLIDLYMSSSD